MYNTGNIIEYGNKHRYLVLHTWYEDTGGCEEQFGSLLDLSDGSHHTDYLERNRPILVIENAFSMISKAWKLIFEEKSNAIDS